MDFHEGAEPMADVVVVPRTEALPLVVVVIDDSEDDELISLIAEAGSVPAPAHHGVWTHLATTRALTIKFNLTREESGWRRSWTYPEPPAGLLDTIEAPHVVAVLSREFAGDPSDFDPHTLGAAVIVEAQPATQLAAGRTLRGG